MELQQNALKVCDVLDQLEGTPLPFYLAKYPDQSVRTLFLEVTREPPYELSGDFTLVGYDETLHIKIVDWNHHGSRIWIKCYVIPPAAPPVPLSNPRRLSRA